MISVIVPVGPSESDKKWLDQCITSIEPQLRGTDEIVLVDDMANIPFSYCSTRTRIHKNDWLLGCASSWNVGISIAYNEWCLMMGADDWLAPDAIQKAVETLTKINDVYGYYHYTIQYFDEETQKLQDIQDLPCNAAIVNKKLWQYTGGFPPECSVGAPDSIFISILLKNKGKAGNLLYINKGTPLYFVRRHKDQDTQKRGSYQGIIFDIRNIVTANWKPVRWGRYE